MFCKNCGKPLAENTLFCSVCGTKIEYETETVAPEDIVENESTSVATAVEEISVSEGEISDEKPKKSHVKGIIASCIGGVIVLTGVLGFAFRNTIFYAISPEKYTGNLIEETLTSIAEEAVKIDENIFGFSYDENDKITAGVNISAKEDHSKGASVDIDYKAANNPDSAELLIDAKISAKQDNEDVSLGIQGFWNDKNIGLGLNIDGSLLNGEIPEGMLDKYFVVSSKEFGKELTNSVIGKEIIEEIRYSYDNVDLKDLDLSYTNIMNMLKDENYDPLKKEIKRDFLEFLDECDISKRRSVKFRFDGDKVNAKKITVSVEAEDFVDLGINVLKSVSEDKYIKDTYGKEFNNLIDDGIRELKNSRKYAEEETQELEIDLIEYKGKIVEISFEVDGDEFAIRAKDKKYILNGIEAEVNSGSEYVVVEYTSNCVNEDKDIFVNASVSQNGSEIASADIQLDYGREKFDFSVSVPGVETYSGGGKCSKKDGFKLSVEDIRIPTSGYVTTNSMEYDEWFDEVYRNAEEKNYGYYVNGENYDDLWDIYYDDFWYDYDSYADWYDAKGKEYDSNYIPYSEWLDSIYDNPEVKDEYDYETGESEYIDYDVVIKCTVSLTRSANVKIANREYVDLFKLTEDDIKEIFGGESAAVAEDIEY